MTKSCANCFYEIDRIRSMESVLQSSHLRHLLLEIGFIRKASFVWTRVTKEA